MWSKSDKIYLNNRRNLIILLQLDQEFRFKDTKRVDEVLDVGDISIFCYLSPINDSIYPVLGGLDFRGDKA